MIGTDWDTCQLLAVESTAKTLHICYWLQANLRPRFQSLVVSGIRQEFLYKRRALLELRPFKKNPACMELPVKSWQITATLGATFGTLSTARPTSAPSRFKYSKVCCRANF
jgi:hypothetical protein